MNGKTRKKKKAIYLRRQKYKKVTKKRIILGLAIIIVTMDL
jgi:hypothetical protein